MATVKAVIRTDKPLKDGTWPVAIRIIAQSKPKYIGLGVSVTKNQWHEKNRLLTGKHPRYREINALIHRMTSDIQARIDDFILQRIEPTTEDLARDKSKRPPADFFKIATIKQEAFLEARKTGTYLQWKSVIEKFRKYLIMDELPVENLTAKMLNNYKSYMSKELHNNDNTIHANMKIIRAVYNDAVKRGYVPNENPFTHISTKPIPSLKDRLNLCEIESIKGLELMPGTNIHLAQQLFLFSFYCWGMRFRDVCLLKPENFNGNQLSYLTSKSGFNKRITLLMGGDAYVIYKYYISFSNTNRPYVFPLLKRVYDEPLEYEKAVGVANETINKALKSIALKAKIDKNISFHTARHSFVDAMKHGGVEPEKRMQMVGHSSEATHRRYHGDFDVNEISTLVNGILG